MGEPEDWVEGISVTRLLIVVAVDDDLKFLLPTPIAKSFVLVVIARLSYLTSVNRCVLLSDKFTT